MEEAEGHLARAARNLAEGPAKDALEKAREAIKKGNEQLTHRQKLIKVADRSELGWAVVAEYETDALADNPDDERRLENAEKAAERKMLAKKRELDAATKLKKVEPGLQERPERGQAVSTGMVSVPKSQAVQCARPGGPLVCYGCGEAGHFRRNRPKRPLITGVYPLSTEIMFGMRCDSPCKGDPLAPGMLPGVELSPEVLSWVEGKGRCWEFQAYNDDHVGGSSIRGRLKQHIDFWVQELCASQWIVGMIKNGYTLPLFVEPSSYRKANQYSACANADFVRKAVNDLVKGRFVEEVAEPPYTSSPLSVVENSVGKKRLVVNLRHVNQFLWKNQFKYEDLRIAMMLFDPGERMFKFDLKSGYHHVEIAVHHRKYLGFEWEGHFYVFAVLPFGLASAPYVFTKLLRPLVRFWRANGLKALMYLDDGIMAVRGEEEAKKASGWVRNTLQKSGFVINEDKSVWTPSYCIAWLGFEIDLLKGQINVRKSKLQALQAMLEGALVSHSLQARYIASIVGKIISMGIALGPVARFMTRNLYALLESRYAWCDVLEISPLVRMELEFWASCLPKYNAQPLWHTPSAVRVVYSDASDTGYGGYTVEHGTHVAQGMWSSEEAVQSSTWRELAAVSRLLDSMAAKLRNARVRWFSDNQNVVRILQVGSRKPNLQEQALRVFETCIIYQIRLEPEWVPRSENELADFISRIVDYDDWQVNPELFYYLEGAWGPHSIDRFADNYNTQVARFNSRFACPGTEAVDAFTVHWGCGENNWWCPPPGLVARVVRHAEARRANGTLVVPHWESAPFWPLLCPDGETFASFFVASEVLPGEGQEVPYVVGSKNMFSALN